MSYSELSDYQYLSKFSSIDQIDPSVDIDLDGKVHINGEDLIDALTRMQNHLIDYRGVLHNELLIYLPRIEGVISKADDISQVPQELLDFAYENNLPVVLI